MKRTTEDILVGEDAARQLVHLPTTTRMKSPHMGRPTDLIRSGELFDMLTIPPLDATRDRVMICGSMAMNLDMKQICEEAGMTEGSNASPGQFVLEKAFVG